eukprot:TRINITY_DN9150_c0_g1_i1.p1 TRINITY_DN9150_c0_g1~~TRINITY_DN9150_c0_g1_i1.p1  ORF type:complete len:442 (+),score=54.02 TRINITY_DN9150_c0_g1_i1:41-1366(+)
MDGQTSQLITVKLKLTNGETFELQVKNSLVIEELKLLLVEKLKVPVQNQRLIYAGHVLKNDLSLTQYGVKDGHTIHVIKSVTHQSQSPNPQNPITNQASGIRGSLFGLSSMPSPDQMSQILQSPLFRNVLDNPDVLREILMNNPQIRDLVSRNPEIGHVLNDPQTLRQTMEMARNPALMREMMRNSDRAMSNISNHPEGFNMLSRMYRNVQEPMMNATLSENPYLQFSANERSSDNPNNSPQSPESGTPNSSALPNPWAPAQSSVPLSQLGGPSIPQSPFGGTGIPPPNDFGNHSQMVQNPMLQNMMQRLASNPELMQQLLQTSPWAQHLNQNPDFRAMISDPQAIQAMFQIYQRIAPLMNGGTPGQNPFSRLSQLSSDPSGQGSNLPYPTLSPLNSPFPRRNSSPLRDLNPMSRKFHLRSASPPNFRRSKIWDSLIAQQI